MKNFFNKNGGKLVKSLFATLLALVVLTGCTLDVPSESDLVSNSSHITTESTLSTESGESAKDEGNSEEAKAEADSSSGTDKTEITLLNIPEYSGKAYVAVNGNKPSFTAEELKSKGYEKYQNLDSLGRTTAAVASVGKDTMPKKNEERGSISDIKPSGWVQAKYDCVSGGWLYNRCHLIGWQLSAENANEKNLITGTKYLNIEGMLPFENMVADYIKETGNHVAYRITPIYKGSNLLASGVLMEAFSVEDNGEGICFNVYCYNVQPGVTINYKTGESKAEKTDSKPTSSNTSCAHSKTTVKNKVAATTTKAGYTGDTYCTGCNVKIKSGKTIPKLIEDNSSKTVYITKTGKKYHSTTYCSGLNNAKAIYESSLSAAQDKGLTECSICY